MNRRELKAELAEAVAEFGLAARVWAIRISASETFVEVRKEDAK